MSTEKLVARLSKSRNANRLNMSYPVGLVLEAADALEAEAAKWAYETADAMLAAREATDD